MAVDALELRPRNAVALFDAAVRLCATSSGVWALTLPTGAAIVASLFSIAEAVRRHESVLVPVAFFTLAWAARAIAQGAACHYVDTQLLGSTTPSMRASAKAALARAPSLLVASAMITLLNVLIGVFTLGIGFLFIGSHGAGYAATMRGQGSIFGVYGTCARLLGPTRSIAPWVRVCGLSQVVLAVNLQLFSLLALGLLSSVFGFDVTFAERFASLDNPTWVVTVVALTFALFEPVRAATASLLLIDGRVRQEGLDLIAQLDQLPARKRNRGLAVVALILFCALPARASALFDRANELSEACEMTVDLEPLERAVAADEQSALSRLISRAEHRAWEDEDCESAEADLREGLKLYAELQSRPAPIDAHAKAAEILARPEFQHVESTPDEVKPEGDEAPGWLATLFKRFLEWLRERKPDQQQRAPTPSGDVSMAGANAVMLGALILVIGVLIFILVRSVRSKKSATALDETGGLVQSALEHDAMSALSKPAETWASLADGLAARGEFREAIRHLYLALLARLHRDGTINYDPTLSNWEYLRAFSGPSSAKSGFKELTRRFDFAWYGHLEIDSGSYQGFRQIAEPMIQPAPGAPARA